MPMNIYVYVYVDKKNETHTQYFPAHTYEGSKMLFKRYLRKIKTHENYTVLRISEFKCTGRYLWTD